MKAAILPPHRTAPLYTETLTERRFRELAGLCRDCGLARKEPGNELCQGCAEKNWRITENAILSEQRRQQRGGAS
jgi:hypothetical protein